MARPWPFILLLAALCTTPILAFWRHHYVAGAANDSTADNELLPRIARVVRQITFQGQSSRCSAGFKTFSGVDGCFKIFPERSTWKQGRAKCLSYNLDMVKVTGDANQLRTALRDTYGQGTFWLGAEADGSGYRWLNGEYLYNRDSLWITGLGSNKNKVGNCLTLSVNDNSIRSHPRSPFGIGRCDSAAVRYKTICEDNSGGGGGCRNGDRTDDGCNTCECVGGRYVCTLKFCPKPGNGFCAVEGSRCEGVGGLGVCSSECRAGQADQSDGSGFQCGSGGSGSGCKCCYIY